ncbi:MAG TPA: sensor histidine kinase [Actinomycetales bacterium]|nr:sensor histidine kinase [Actinomycetales bacterium]
MPAPTDSQASGRGHGAASGAGSSPVLRGLQLGQHALFAALLAVGAARAAADSGHTVLAIVGAVLLALWYAGGALVARRRRDRVTGAVWLAVLLLGWLGLVAVSAQFTWVAFALFFLCLHLLPLRAGLGVVAGLTVVVIASQLSTPDGNRAAQVLGPCFGLVVAVGMSLAYRRLVAENLERRHLIAELLAAQEDLVVTHDALAAAQRESGALVERARLARDIHDTLAQGFSSIVLLARAGLAEADAGTGGRGQPADTSAVGHDTALLRRIVATASENLDEARRVVHALAPAALEQAPLPAALGRLLYRTAEQVPVRTELRCDGEPVVLPKAVEVALLRLAQGALANVRQHARATRVSVTVTYGDAEVRLDVVDDGVGFDPVQVPERSADGAGFGLRAMRERLADVGGDLDVESAPGQGTAVVATVPVPLPGAGEGS